VERKLLQRAGYCQGRFTITPTFPGLGNQLGESGSTARAVTGFTKSLNQRSQHRGYVKIRFVIGESLTAVLSRRRCHLRSWTLDSLDGCADDIMISPIRRKVKNVTNAKST
jgi:hypothetical protein